MNKTIIWVIWSLCSLYPSLLTGQTLSPQLDTNRADYLQITYEILTPPEIQHIVKN